MTIPTTASDIQLSCDLLQLIVQLNRWSTRNADTRLPLGQARLLSLIDELGAARISELAIAENCTQPGMTQQVKRLEEARLVGRAPDPSDARAVLISVTPDGLQLLQGVRQARAQAVAPVIGQLTGRARHDLQNALVSLSQLLDIAVDKTPTTGITEI